MCGICGELSLTPEAVAEQNVRAMADSLRHRGPDGSGYYFDGQVGLGHRRLSIIDLSEGGRQPMWSSDGRFCITFNGEIYNYRELSRRLQAEGVRLRSSSDTEVLVNAVQLWGLEKAVRLFVGMFAFGLWDARERRLSLVRDRAGIKPLFYWIGPDRVLFGSELRALLAHPAFPKQLDRVGLGQFLVTGFSLGEYTIFQDTKRVPPGHAITFSVNGRVETTRYWSLHDVHRSPWNGGFEDAADALEELLVSAFGYRLVSDVPVASFLSGGIDSSLVAAILKRRVGQDVLNISVGFAESAFDEAPKASEVAKALDLRHEVHYVSPQEAEEELIRFPEVFDEPFGDTSGIPTAILSRLARQHVKVALSADGGDEQFCGYESYSRYARAHRVLGYMPVGPRRGVARVLEKWLPLGPLLAFAGRSDSLRPQTAARVRKALRIAGTETVGDLVRMMYEKAWGWEDVQAVAGAGGSKLYDNTVLADRELLASDDELIGVMMRTDYQAFMRDDILTKVDRASMHVSLEARDPMLDHRIAEFAFSLPIDYVLGEQGEHKRILKHLLRRWVPESVVSSPKRGFSIPLYAWMRGIWKPIVMDYLSSDSVRRVGILDAAIVEDEVRKFYAYPGRSSERIWMMLNLQRWASRWLT